MSDLIIAIDPGATTGVAVGVLTGPRTFDLQSTCVFPWDKRFDLVNWIPRLGPQVVVCEDFRLYEHAKDSQVGSMFPSVRIIGMLEYICDCGSIPIVFQMASVRSNVQIRTEHKEMIDKTGQHATDAYKHLRYWVLTHKIK